MKKINFAIISYKRPECISVNTLLDLGVEKENITIFVQGDENDFVEYKKNHNDVNIVVNKNIGVNANRNNALRHYNDGEYIVLLDDDVLSFVLLSPISEEKISSRKIKDTNVFLNILSETFEECEKLGVFVWGIAPTANAMFAKGRLFSDGTYSINRLFQGGMIGHIKNEIYYDETYKFMTDYELQLRYYSKGYIVLRRNDIAANKKPNGNYKGGLFDEYRIPDNRKIMMERLKAQYGDYIDIKPDYSGLKQKI